MTEDNRPTVSVIIPSYNAAAYIGQAVSSALASEDVSVEIIVVDDGSDDGTWQLLESFGDRIRRARQERGGPYRARNLGAQLARGEWLAFLDADDDWLPTKLTAQLALATTDIGLVYTDRLNFGDISRIRPRQSDSVDLWEGDVFEHLLLGNFITLSSVLLQKSWFDKLGGFSIARTGVQDWDMWLRYAAEGGKVALCREPLTRYRWHTGQMSNDLGKRAADREAVLRSALASPRGKRVPPAVIRKAFAGLWELAAWNASSTGGTWAPIIYLFRSACYWPWNMRVYKSIAKCCIGRG